MNEYLSKIQNDQKKLGKQLKEIRIKSVICFTVKTDDDWGRVDYYYEPEFTHIKRVVDLELNEGAPPIPTTTEHYKMLEKHWEKNDVYDEI